MKALGPSPKQRLHRLDDLAQTHGLFEEEVSAGFEGIVLGIFAAGRDGYYRQLGVLRLLADGPNDGGTVDEGKIDVDHQEVKGVAEQELQCLPAVGCAD